MQWLVKGVIVAISLVVIWFASQWGMANVYYFTVYNKLTAWEKQSSELTLEQLDELGSAVDGMLSYHPDHPHYLVTAAKWQEWYAFYYYGQGDQARPYLEQALAYYRASAELRPGWPETWVNMVNLKVRLDAFDQELFDYMVKATKAGPYNEHVNQGIAKIFLYHWKQFNAEMATLGLSHVERTLQSNNAGKLFQYAKAIGRQGLLCQLIEVKQFKVSGDIACSY
jgi:hypothetical protein